MRNWSKPVNRDCLSKNRGLTGIYAKANLLTDGGVGAETMRISTQGKQSHMDITLTPLAGVFVLKPKRLRDSRGFFSETYSRRRLADAGLNVDFVQDNVSVSNSPGTLRGL